MKPIKLLLVEDYEGDRFVTPETAKKISNIIQIQMDKEGTESFDYFHKKESYSKNATSHFVLSDKNLNQINDFKILAGFKSSFLSSSSEDLQKLLFINSSISRPEENKVLTIKKSDNSILSKPIEADDLDGIMRTTNGKWDQVDKILIN